MRTLAATGGPVTPCWRFVPSPRITLPRITLPQLTNSSPTRHQLVTNSSPTHRQVPSAVTVDEGSVTATGFAVLASAPDTQGKDFAGYAFQCTDHTADAPSPACDPAGEWSSPVQATDGGC